MIRLIYVSRSLSPLPLELKDILRSSRKNNVLLDITGALCFLDGVYFQYLEGETVALQDLYKRIVADPRHTDARLLDRSRIGRRIFGTWSMALVTWNEDTRAAFAAVNGDGPADLYGMAETRAAATFEAMVASTNWQEVAA